MFVKARIEGLVLNPVSGSPVAILREQDGKRTLPVLIGVVEAASIAMAIEKRFHHDPTLTI